jgi:archaellum component FlaC
MAEFLKLDNNALGGNVEELDSFAGYLTTTAIPDMEALLTKIDQQINKTHWSGNDAVKYAADWTSMSNDFKTKFRDLMSQQSESAKKQANDQRATSGN